MTNPRSWLHADETAAQMVARVDKERPNVVLSPLNRVIFRSGNVVEITGPSPSAKSEILLQAAIQCILPKEWNGVRFDGLERVVAYIDLDCRFDVFRFAQVLKLRITSAFGLAHGTHWGLDQVSPRNTCVVSQADNLDDELFLSCMKRFLYTRCYNSSEFLAALKTAHPASVTSSEGLDVSLYIVIIDSIGAFHWIDRACQPLTKDGSTREKLSLEKLTENVVQEINKIRKVQPLLVLASKATIFGTATPTNDAHSKVFHTGHEHTRKHDSDKILYREYMSPVWQLFVTQKVFLGISDANCSNGRNGEFPTHICEWIKPPLDGLNKFVVKNDGICMIS